MDVQATVVVDDGSVGCTGGVTTGMEADDAAGAGVVTSDDESAWAAVDAAGDAGSAAEAAGDVVGAVDAGSDTATAGVVDVPEFDGTVPRGATDSLSLPPPHPSSAEATNVNR